MANPNVNTIPGLPYFQDPMFSDGGYTSRLPGATPNPTGSNLVPGNPSVPLPSTSIGGGLIDAPIVPGTGSSGNTEFPINTGPTTLLGGTNIAGLNPSSSTGIPVVGSTDYTNLSKQLDGIFGSGMGSVLLGYLSGGGGFNPQVAAALQNAQIPQEQRALANIREAFGAQGLGGGSNEALAVGDYESAFNLGQEGLLANLYQGGANNIRDMLSGILNTAFLDKSNKNGVLDTINSLLPILGALGLTGAGGSLGNLLKGILGKLTGSKGGVSVGGGGGVGGGIPGIGGGPSVYGQGPDVGDPNLNPTLGTPAPQPGDPYGVADIPFPTGDTGLPGTIPGVGLPSDLSNLFPPYQSPGVTNVETSITDPITGQPIDTSSWWNDPSFWYDPNSQDVSNQLMSDLFNYQNAVLDSSLYGGADLSSF